MERNKALDGLRGIAALAVIFYHAILHREVLVSTVLIEPIQGLSSVRDILTKIALLMFNGHSAVILFFVLSGFVLTLSLERMSGVATDVTWRFVVRRLFRLYPALFICMLFYYALSVLFSVIGVHGMPRPDFVRAMTNATLVDITWHGPSRTIQGEMLAIPFVVVFFWVYKVFGVPALLVAFGYSILAINDPWLVLWAPNMAVWLLSFVGGMLLAQPGFSQFFTKTSALGICFIALVFLALRGFVWGSAAITVIGVTILAMALVGAIHYGQNRSVERVLDHKIMQFLGRISYSLYLLNVPLLMVAWSVTDRFGWYNNYALETGLIVGVVVALATMPLAYFVTTRVEEPLMRLGKALTESRQFSVIRILGIFEGLSYERARPILLKFKLPL